MIGRPCKPDADFERLWRALLPGTPFPACGMPAAGERGEQATGSCRDDAAGEQQRPAQSQAAKPIDWSRISPVLVRAVGWLRVSFNFSQ